MPVIINTLFWHSLDGVTSSFVVDAESPANFRMRVDGYPDFLKNAVARINPGECCFLQNNLPLMIPEFEESFLKYSRHKASLFDIFLYKNTKHASLVHFINQIEVKSDGRPFTSIFI